MHAGGRGAWCENNVIVARTAGNFNCADSSDGHAGTNRYLRDMGVDDEDPGRDVNRAVFRGGTRGAESCSECFRVVFRPIPHGAEVTDVENLSTHQPYRQADQCEEPPQHAASPSCTRTPIYHKTSALNQDFHAGSWFLELYHSRQL
jgi:hypothetical protein